MTRLARILIAGTAALMPMTQAFADGSSESEIINGQINLNSIWTNNNMQVDNVNGDVNGSAAAVGNALEAVTMNNTIVSNSQYASGAAIGADMNAMVTNVNGSVNLNTQVGATQPTSRPIRPTRSSTPRRNAPSAIRHRPPTPSWHKSRTT